jgi:hypothetical protein
VGGKKKTKINAKCKCSRKLDNCNWWIILNGAIQIVENSAEWTCEIEARFSKSTKNISNYFFKIPNFAIPIFFEHL